MKHTAISLASSQMMALEGPKKIVVKVILPGAIVLRFKSPSCPLINLYPLSCFINCVPQFSQLQNRNMIGTVKKCIYTCLMPQTVPNITWSMSHTLVIARTQSPRSLPSFPGIWGPWVPNTSPSRTSTKSISSFMLWILIGHPQTNHYGWKLLTF